VSAPLAPESDVGLVFTWDAPRRRKGAITGFLLASLMLHALCFYVFQIIYPPAVALLPPPARVTVIAANTNEERVLLRWLEAEDPAHASTTQPLNEKSLTIPTIQHAPSYLMRQPALKEAPPLPLRPGIPSAQPPGPVEAPSRSIQTVAKNSPTMLRFSPELESMGFSPGLEIRFTASRRESPQVAQFRVAVNENGEVRYCFLENSSGDGTLDEQARKYLALGRFSAIHNSKSEIRDGLVWGTAMIEWGNDVAVPPAAATESVTP
jgi:hypothetical protein